MDPGWMPAVPCVEGRVIGVGVDVVDLDEFREAVASRIRIARLVFTGHERRTCRGPQQLERLGARFAAKEAAFKAVGTGWGNGVRWHDAEVSSRAGEAPELTLRGELLRHAHDRGGQRVAISLSHSGTYAAAIAVLVGR